MPKPQSFELIEINRELKIRAREEFPWALVASSEHEALAHDAGEICVGRSQELDALMRQAEACRDAQKRLSASGLFSAWIETQTTISRRTAYRMANCFERVGWYHKHALRQGQVSPLKRFDYGTILYVLSDPDLCPEPLLNELLHKTIDLIQSGKELVVVSRKSVLDSASRYRNINKSTGNVYLGGTRYHATKDTPPDEQHTKLVLRSKTQDALKVSGGTLPPVTYHADTRDEQQTPVPAALVPIFTSREHFVRIREALLGLAKELHTLTHTPAGRDLHRSNYQKLLSVAQDLNLSCPALVEPPINWASSKTLIRRTYRDKHRAYYTHGTDTITLGTDPPENAGS